MSAAGGGERKGLIWGLVIGIVAGLALTGLGAGLVGGAGDSGERVADALELIEREYFVETDRDELTDASIEGIVRKLRRENEDRFSHYFSPDAYDRFLDSTEGRFSGIGLTVSEVKRGLRVASVFEDTPAQRAGITAGDVITGVDGKSLAGVSADEATARIKGPPGSEVRLELLDSQTKETRALKVERANVRIPAVRGELIDRGEEQIAFVNLFGFTSGAHSALREEIARLDRRGADALVLDLRGNGGGLLSEAVLVGGIFVEDGVVVATSGRAQADRELEAEGDAIDERPLVVLVNGDTASSAEIVAAAIASSGVGTLIGTKTFGKGTFQEVIPLDGGGALDITVGEFFTADGTSLAGNGLKPEIRVEDDPTTSEVDEARKRAVRALLVELRR